MSDYITNTAELTAIADAIRAKGSTTASLVYPDGFVSAIEDIESGGGGASNFVHGTFTTGRSSSAADLITIPYTGNGYPVMAVVVVAGGVYNPAYSDWYDKVQQYAVGQWAMTKSVMSSTPTYTTSGAENKGDVIALCKSSTSSSTSYSSWSGTGWNSYTSRYAYASATGCVCFKSNTKLSYAYGSSGYKLMNKTNYEYFIVYSE